MYENLGSAASSSAEDVAVVIAHDFVETFGGAERILASIAKLFPDAPVWAIAGRRSVAERMGIADRLFTVLPEREFLLRHYRLLAPAYPGLTRRHRLPEADVLLTSSYAFAHGFRTKNDAPQLCYCYSPPRFAWSMTAEYSRRSRLGRLGVPMLAAATRRADRRAAANVSRYVAESHHVAGVIRTAYGRESRVIHPPVDCSLFTPSLSTGHDGYFLFCGRLTEPYKRAGVVIDAFRALPHLRLVVAGDGPVRRELQARAGSNVEFVGHLADEDVVSLMQRCAASVFPSRDDFGLVPVETMACGRPVLAFAEGGALETVVPGVTGELFANGAAEGLRDALIRFEPDRYDPETIRLHALRWDLPVFELAIREAVSALARASVADLEPQRNPMLLDPLQLLPDPERV